MTWVMGRRAQSASLQKTGVVYTPEGWAAIQKGLNRLEKNGLTGTSLIQQGEMWSLLPGGKITAGTSTGWRSSGWKAPCQKKPWGSWWIPSQSWASNVPLWPQKLKASGTASGSVLLGGGGRWSFLSALPSVSSADLPRIRDTWTYWRGPSKRPGGQ